MSLGPPPASPSTSPDDPEVPPRGSTTPEDDLPPPPLSCAPPTREVNVVLVTVSEADGIFSASECRMSEKAVEYVRGTQSMWISAYNVATLAPQEASKRNIAFMMRKAVWADLWVSPAVLIDGALRAPSTLEAVLAVKGVPRVTYAQLLGEGERLVPPPAVPGKLAKATHQLTLQGDVSSSSEEFYPSRVVRPAYKLVYAVVAESILRDAQRASVVKAALVVAGAAIVSSTESQTDDAAASLLIVDDGPSTERCDASDNVVVRSYSQLVAWVWRGGALDEPRSKKVSFATRSPEVCLLTPRSVEESFPRQSTRSKKLRKRQAQTQAQAQAHSQPQVGEHGRVTAGGEVPPPLLLAPNGDGRMTRDGAASM